MIADGWVIAGAGALFCIEFVADKVPFFDLVWNALQTFVRVPVAAFVAYGAASQLSPPAQLLTAIVGAAIAFAAHGGKTAARVAVTPSPEPFSNIALSFGEDVLAVGLTWFATQYPFIAAGIVVLLVLILVFLTRTIVRAIQRTDPAASKSGGLGPKSVHREAREDHGRVNREGREDREGVWYEEFFECGPVRRRAPNPTTPPLRLTARVRKPSRGLAFHPSGRG